MSDVNIKSESIRENVVNDENVDCDSVVKIEDSCDGDEVEGDAAADVVDERVVVVEESVADDDDRLSLNAHEDDEQLDYD